MNWTRILVACAVALLVESAPGYQKDPDIEFVCPMDKDVRSSAPGICPRCGMKLVAGIPEGHEFRVLISTAPAVLEAEENIRITLRVEDPETGKPARAFEIMHEKLYHLFVVSQDLRFFAHVHPEIRSDSSFVLDLTFPRPGLYRILSDFYPAGATPQLIASTLIVRGAEFKLKAADIAPDLSPKTTENSSVELVSEPVQPIAGLKTMLFFRLKPDDGIEPWIGAMGHMLAASADLIDLMHTHPIYVTDPDGAKQLQFNLIFPREGMYRIWVQFQRKGVVNTVAFNVPVKALE
ncbi:MAG: heavy metal-binding domain-containing protein [Bryobacteraceae bacterium]|jgi:heavy metal-binding protein